MKKYLLSAARCGVCFCLRNPLRLHKRIAAAFTKQPSDFTAKKLSLAINCKTGSHKIKINDIFSQDHITVVHDGKSLISKNLISMVINYVMVKPLDSPEIKNYQVMNPNEMILLYKVEGPSDQKPGSPKNIYLLFQ